jgi:hypothetical protein
MVPSPNVFDVVSKPLAVFFPIERQIVNHTTQGAPLTIEIHAKQVSPSQPLGDIMNGRYDLAVIRVDDGRIYNHCIDVGKHVHKHASGIHSGRRNAKMLMDNRPPTAGRPFDQTFLDGPTPVTAVDLVGDGRVDLYAGF